MKPYVEQGDIRCLECDWISQAIELWAHHQRTVHDGVPKIPGEIVSFNYLPRRWL